MVHSVSSELSLSSNFVYSLSPLFSLTAGQLMKGEVAIITGSGQGIGKVCFSQTPTSTFLVIANPSFPSSSGNCSSLRLSWGKRSRQWSRRKENWRDCSWNQEGWWKGYWLRVSSWSGRREFAWWWDRMLTLLGISLPHQWRCYC